MGIVNAFFATYFFPWRINWEMKLSSRTALESKLLVISKKVGKLPVVSLLGAALSQLLGQSKIQTTANFAVQVELLFNHWVMIFENKVHETKTLCCYHRSQNLSGEHQWWSGLSGRVPTWMCLWPTPPIFFFLKMKNYSKFLLKSLYYFKQLLFGQKLFFSGKKMGVLIKVLVAFVCFVLFCSWHFCFVFFFTYKIDFVSLESLNLHVSDPSSNINQAKSKTLDVAKKWII